MKLHHLKLSPPRKKFWIRLWRKMRAHRIQFEQFKDKFLSVRLRQGSASTALPLWPLSPSPTVVFIPETVGTAAPGSLFKATPSMFMDSLPAEGTPSPSRIALRDLWTGTGRRTLDDKQRIGQIRCILEKTAVSAVKKTFCSRIKPRDINLLQAAPGLGRDELAPAADRGKFYNEEISNLCS
ncbi:hypothetical protein DPMN_183671 [Dreissena polymorpha]|uniref:Uncharacterized protein n=1 Tax=Dreissena polymorpha TaxID=45954 RepID=A0A9D4DIT9_DREPO|nr:hypothetical protein DPMN_183671 [Dreissena polymorpha]